jgi:hypothetical protein
MSFSPEVYQEWGHGVVGNKLHDVIGLIYVFQSPDLEHPQQLQLIFTDPIHNVNFRCGADGATLDFTKTPIRESDFGEYGKEVVMSMSDSLLFQKYIGRCVSKVFLIYSDTENTTVGIRVVFDAELNLIIINLGDEINFFDSLPLKYEEDEGLSYIDMSI